jgi:hypothetical protein
MPLYEGLSWPWSDGSWIYNYLCNQYLSPLMLWVRISIRARCTILCEKICQWLVTGRGFLWVLTDISWKVASCLFVYLMVFNATFNNISAISWQSVLLMEETGGPRENHDLSQVIDKLFHIILYTSPWSRFELTTSVVIGTDCIDSCKSNYHTITAMTYFIVSVIKVTCTWQVVVFSGSSSFLHQ